MRPANFWASRRKNESEKQVRSTTEIELMSSPLIDRRRLLQISAGLTGLALTSTVAGQDKPVDRSRPTRFQIACMTLPYSAFPLERALSGIKEAGYRHVAWGTRHKESDGKTVPVLASNA